MTRKGKSTDKLSVLFTCIGRRVSLLKSFRDAARRLKISLAILGTDANELSPALQLCDKKFLVSRINSPDYIPQLLRICKKEKVNLIVPTIDTELLMLAQNRARFAELGCTVLISDPKVIHICQDKRKTHKYLSDNGFDTPITITPAEALKSKKLKLPVMVKPWDGAASKGATCVKNQDELRFFSKRLKKCIIQEFVPGSEFTCDAFVDFDMNVRCVIPRKRLETRAGEVSKGQIVKNKKIMNKVAQLVQKLGAGPGVITVQLILSPDKKIKFIEINPRFGGGVPLAIKAGADFPKWLLQQLVGRKSKISFNGFKDGLKMLRYDAEVWL